jgi:hypothetical protein
VTPLDDIREFTIAGAWLVAYSCSRKASGKKFDLVVGRFRETSTGCNSQEKQLEFFAGEAESSGP